MVVLQHYYRSSIYLKWAQQELDICLLHLQGIEEVEHGEETKLSRVTNHRIQVHREGTKETETGSKDGSSWQRRGSLVVWSVEK